MIKRLLGILLLSLSVNVSADVSDDVLKAAISSAEKVAIAAVNQGETKTTVSNSIIENTTSLTESASIGNSGVSVKGETTDIQDSDLINSTTMTRSASWGNSGIEIGN